MLLAACNDCRVMIAAKQQHQTSSDASGGCGRLVLCVHQLPVVSLAPDTHLACEVLLALFLQLWHVHQLHTRNSVTVGHDWCTLCMKLRTC